LWRPIVVGIQYAMWNLSRHSQSNVRGIAPRSRSGRTRVRSDCGRLP
jgi:hypothetical protein